MRYLCKRDRPRPRNRGKPSSRSFAQCLHEKNLAEYVIQQ